MEDERQKNGVTSLQRVLLWLWSWSEALLEQIRNWERKLMRRLLRFGKKGIKKRGVAYCIRATESIWKKMKPSSSL